MKHFAIIPNRSIRRGDTLLMSVIFLLAVSVIVITLFDRTAKNISVTSRRINDPVTTGIAESGIEKAVYCLNNAAITAPTCPRDAQGKYIGESSVVIGKGSYTTSVSASGQTATISVTAATAGLGGGSSKQIEATLTQAASLNPAFQFGVQAGEGGIRMEENASVIGNVYTNGSITGANNSSVTGDAILAVSGETLDVTSNPPGTLIKNVADADNTVYIAQKFVSGVNDTVHSIELKLARNSSPVPNLTAYIYTDNSNNPGTNISGSGQVLNTSLFPSTSPSGWENGWTKQMFNPNSILLQDTAYWLVLKAASTSNLRFWTTVRSSDDTAYIDGTAKAGSALGSLDALGYDIAFRINVGGQYPTLEVPTVGGNAYSHIIEDTTVGKHAYYQVLEDTVKANGGGEICTLTPCPSCYCHPASTDQPPQNFPISGAQIAQLEAIAEAGGTVTCSSTCTIPSGSSIGPKKYIGNVAINNHAVVTLTGTVWVKGNLSLDNGAILQLDAGYGTDNGIIIADNPDNITSGGTIAFSNNGDLRGSSNASCTGPTNAKRCSDGLNKNNSCSVAGDCPMNSIMAISMNADPTLTTSAISVSNNLSAGVLYAPYGLASIQNNANLKEVTAQKLYLANNATIKYMTGLASAIFSSGPGASWQLKPGSYHIVK